MIQEFLYSAIDGVLVLGIVFAIAFVHTVGVRAANHFYNRRFHTETKPVIILKRDEVTVKSKRG